VIQLSGGHIGNNCKSSTKIKNQSISEKIVILKRFLLFSEAALCNQKYAF